MKHPTVSVVIPTFNRSELVVEAIESVLAQSVIPTEILVIDDGSEDDTRDRLSPLSVRIKYVYQNNRGVSAARNRGLKEASGNIIAFLDADDIWHPEKLAVQLQVLSRFPEVGIVSTTRFDWPRDVIPEYGERDIFGSLAQVYWEQLAVRNFLDTSSIVVRREVLDLVGGFDDQLQGPEDHDLWLRIAEVTNFLHINIPLTGYRQTPGSLSKQADRMLRDKYRMLQKQTQRPIWQGRTLPAEKRIVWSTTLVITCMVRRAVIELRFSHCSAPSRGILYRTLRRNCLPRSHA